METRAHYILIGLFILTVFAGALLFVLWMTTFGSEEDSDVYDVVFQESVIGLSIGSRVLYSGIHVGRVESLELDVADPRRVIARIRVAGNTPVKADTRAQLVLANITGAMEIQLSAGSPQSLPLESTGEAVPRIKADPSGIARLKGTGTELFDQATQLLERANRLVSGENAENLARTLDNLATFSQLLAEEEASVRETLQSLAATGRETEQLIARMNGLVHDRGDTLADSAERTLASLERTTADLERLLKENEAAVTSGMQGLTAIGPALDELRATLVRLGNVARRLDEDPGGYLFGRESVEEFQP